MSRNLEIAAKVQSGELSLKGYDERRERDNGPAEMSEADLERMRTELPEIVKSLR